MSRFPHLPETFILREMNALKEFGWEIALYPIIVQQQDVVHDEARPWIAEARDIPFLSLAVLGANFRVLFRHPRKYLQVFWRSLWDNRSSPKFLVRALVMFPKAVFMKFIVS